MAVTFTMKLETQPSAKSNDILEFFFFNNLASFVKMLFPHSAKNNVYLIPNCSVVLSIATYECCSCDA